MLKMRGAGWGLVYGGVLIGMNAGAFVGGIVPWFLLGLTFLLFGILLVWTSHLGSDAK